METISLHDREPGLQGDIEALLFVAPTSIPISQLATVLNRSVHEIEQALAELERHYDTDRQFHGLQIQRHHGRVQLTTVPSVTAQIEKLLGLEATSRLSRAALETLAIIAYKEPVTRPQIDSIRGVNSDGVLKSLLSKGLIQEIGRSESPGRPILYSVTPDFLQHFGLSSLADLPSMAGQPSSGGDNENPI